jgi:hypothetical protein
MVIRKAFNIALRDTDGNNVPLTDSVTVRLLIDEELRERLDLKVIYIDSKGNVTDMNAVRVGDYLVFETNHFSVFAVVSREAGSSIGLIIGVSLIVLITISVLFMLFYRKRQIVKSA